MTTPHLGTDNVIVSDLQTQSQASGLITVFEIILPESDIGGPGNDKLYFHDGASGSNDIEWYSLKDEANFGSASSSHYGVQTYSAFPVESEGWEVRGSGTGSLPRPTVRFANINQYWSANLSNFDDLIGAKVIRRRTLAKYLRTGEASAGANNPPVELNRDVYYIERKSSETPILVEFELTSAFDVQGIKLPRRTIIAARCPWKYKDSDQGGCDWPADNRFTIDGVEQILYFDKDDVRITTHPTWGRQDVVSNRTSNLYAATSYSVGDYVEYYRPIGGLIAATGVGTGANVTYTGVDTGHGLVEGDFVIAKGFTDADANFKSIPLYVSASTANTVTVQNPSATITSSSGFLQLTRVTLYKCITAHSIAVSDSADDIVKPTNVSYWEFGDVCGKRLNSCAIRYGHNPAGTGVSGIIVDQVTTGTGASATRTSGGSGYTSATISFSGGGGSGASANVTVSGGRVVGFTNIVAGSGYTSAPTVTISGNGSGATATAQINTRGTRNVSLPFGGFPGAALY